MLLHEKLLKIPGNQYRKTYKNKPRNLKTQNGYIQKVTEIKTKLEIKSKLQTLHQRWNPFDVVQFEYYLHLQQNVIKREIGRETLRHLALETMNTKYPQDIRCTFLQMVPKKDEFIKAGADIHCEPFSCYIPRGQHSTAFDGEIEAIRTTLRLLNLHQNRFERAVIFLTQRLQYNLRHPRKLWYQQNPQNTRP